MPAAPNERVSWFVHDRFGMFIHWGLYALAARHEWVKNFEELDDAHYQRYFERFDPDLYDPAEWADRARRAGMKYAVLTSKHHEGFCLWDSALTDYRVTNTPYGKDLVRPFLEEFRAAGLRVGLYHSLIDWHHPDFPIDILHPQRNHPEAARLNEGRDMGRYVEYLHGQVRELLTEYGSIDILWLDFSYPEMNRRGFKGKGRADWQSDRLIEMVRDLAPGILVNNRADLPADAVDLFTPEQIQPRGWVEVEGRRVVWEACHTFSGSWGYHRDETSWKSPEQLIRLLIESVAVGGNLLMNVGPTGRGRFDRRAGAALDVYAEWMALHNRSIYGCTQSDFAPPQDCRLTQNGDRLYIHVLSWPFERLYFDGLAGRIAYAQLLNDASEIRFAEGAEGVVTHNGIQYVGGDAVTFHLPVRKPDVVVPVIEVFLKNA